MEDIQASLKGLPLSESIALVINAIRLSEGFLLKAQLEKLERENALNLLKTEDYQLTWNRILNGWHYTIDHLTDIQLRQIAARSFFHIAPDQITPKLRVASLLLRQWKREFEHLSGSHIDRSQTAEILAWIDGPPIADQRGILLLAGDPGSGKSVVMGDLLRELEARNVPVLGLKADQDYAENLEALSKTIQLDEGIEHIIRALAQSMGRVVVLVDQIDALSQSLSIRREYLNTFTRLVATLGEIPNVRVVVSCRTYDLQNDHSFNFYRNQRTVTLGELEDGQVRAVLQNLSFPKGLELPADLFRLLKTPLHLDIFCRIYRSDLPFATFKALRNLYEELWSQRVVKDTTTANIDPQKCEILIAEMAQMMYECQSLALAATLLNTRYSQELTYLQSAGIVIPSRKGLVFFHQTFYEFAFAKQFVARKVPLEKYLEENGQNLHIRSCLKMILEFLRESDPQEYLRVNQTVLTSPDFYFHIKSLLLSVLGFMKELSSEEMRLVRDHVFSDWALFKSFVASVNSPGWLFFLMDEKQLPKLIEPSESSNLLVEGVEKERYQSRVNILNALLRRHVVNNQPQVLAFLESLPDHDHKAWLIERSLYEMATWEHPLAFKLFDVHCEKIPDFMFFKLLEKGATTNLSWALNHLKSAIEKVIGMERRAWEDVKFEYDLTALIKHFIENYPQPAFDLLLEIQIQQLLQPKEGDEYPDEGCAIVWDYPGFSIDIDSRRVDKTSLLSLLVSSTQKLATEQLPRFAQFIQDTTDSNSGARLLILVEGFRANPSAFLSDISPFLLTFLGKCGFEAHSSLAWHTRQLLQEAYPYLSASQKGQIIQLISQIESKSEQARALGNDKSEWVGVERLRWLQCIPNKDLAQFSVIEQMASELRERFPGLEDREPYRARTYVVGPPMEREEYATMTLSQWKESFAKYSPAYEAEWASNKGGMEQHAQKFEEEVKKRPGFFFPLIEELTVAHGLPTTYLVHGLDGLKAAKYSPESLLMIFKKIDYTDWDNLEIIRLISLCAYFIEAKIDDDCFFNFLIKMARTHSDPTDEALRVTVVGDEVESIFVSGYNTVRGSAVHLVPYCYYLKRHEALIFETLEHVAGEDVLAVRCQMMPNLAVLTNLDGPRTIRLFLHLIRSGEDALMKYSALSAQHLAWQDFRGMRTYFEEALNHPRLYHDMGIILSLIWVFERAEALDWLERFMAISDEAINGSIEVAAHNICDEAGQPITKSIELFGRFLLQPTERIIQAYHLAFHHLKPSDFPHLQATLLQFSQSVIAHKNPGSFYKYLISCAEEYPAVCLELVKDFDQYEKPDIRFSGHYNREPLKVVLNAYHSLWGKKFKQEEDWRLLKKALLLFDKMLHDERFSTIAYSALEQIER